MDQAVTCALCAGAERVHTHTLTMSVMQFHATNLSYPQLRFEEGFLALRVFVSVLRLWPNCSFVLQAFLHEASA